jgi:hypothetical protein
MVVTVSTIESPDGVIGLNGRMHLLDDKGEIMKFDTIEQARQFIEDAGEDPDNEYIDYEESEECQQE